MKPKTSGEQENRPHETHEGERRGAGRAGRMGAPDMGAAAELAPRLREGARHLSGQVREQARKRPFVALSAAAGAGFVAGSLLGSRLGQVLVAASVGYFAKGAPARAVGEW